MANRIINLRGHFNDTVGETEYRLTGVLSGIGTLTVVMEYPDTLRINYINCTALNDITLSLVSPGTIDVEPVTFLNKAKTRFLILDDEVASTQSRFIGLSGVYVGDERIIGYDTGIQEDFDNVDELALTENTRIGVICYYPSMGMNQELRRVISGDYKVTFEFSGVSGDYSRFAILSINNANTYTGGTDLSGQYQKGVQTGFSLSDNANRMFVSSADGLGTGTITLKKNIILDFTAAPYYPAGDIIMEDPNSIFLPPMVQSPVNVTAPAIVSGTAREGNIITLRHGAFRGRKPIAVVFEVWTSLTGITTPTDSYVFDRTVTGDSFIILPSDAGKYIQVREKATNIYYETQAGEQIYINTLTTDRNRNGLTYIKMLVDGSPVPPRLTPTATASNTPTPSTTNTSTSTTTATPTPSISESPSPTPTNTPTPSATNQGLYLNGTLLVPISSPNYSSPIVLNTEGTAFTRVGSDTTYSLGGVISGSSGTVGIDIGSSALTLSANNTFQNLIHLISGSINVTGSLNSAVEVNIGSQGSTAQDRWFQMTVPSERTLKRINVSNNATGTEFRMYPTGTGLVVFTQSCQIYGSTLFRKMSTGSWGGVRFNGIVGGTTSGEVMKFANNGGAIFHIEGGTGTYNYSGNIRFMNSHGIDYRLQGQSVFYRTAKIILDEGALVYNNFPTRTLECDVISGDANSQWHTFNNSNVLLSIGWNNGGITTDGIVADYKGRITIATGSNSLRIEKNGTGEQKLSGNNNYNGGTKIISGTMTAGHANAFGTGTITIESEGTLNKGGFTLPNTIVNNGGTIIP